MRSVILCASNFARFLVVDSSGTIHFVDRCPGGAGSWVPASGGFVAWWLDTLIIPQWRNVAVLSPGAGEAEPSNEGFPKKTDAQGWINH
jgi:hypothetical protein